MSRRKVIAGAVAAGAFVTLAMLLPRRAAIVWPVDPHVTLRVVLADGTPAAHARVDVGALRARSRGHPFHPYRFLERPLVDPEPMATFVAGEDGTVALPWLHEEFGDVPVSARLDAAYGEVTLLAAEPPGATHELQLAPDATLRVRVLDAEGLPAADVELITQGTLQHPDGSEAVDLWHARARTDADGTATFVHAQVWAQHIAARGERRPFEVCTWLPGIALAATLDGANLPHEPVELRLPPTGRIEVVTLDAAGSPFREAEVVVMQPIDDSHGNILVPNADSGLLVVPRAPLGKSWETWMPVLSGVLEFEGPKRVGETVSITLRASTQPTLVGRLVERATPIPNAEVTLTADGQRLGEARTDALGRFRVATAATFAGLLQRIDVTARDANGQPLEGRFRGELRHDGDAHGLGDVRVEPKTPPQVMLAGRILAPRGLESLAIDVQQRIDTSASSVDPDITLKPDGTFVVYGPDPGEPLQLLLTSHEHEPVEPIRFGYGAIGREIELTPAITVHVPFVIASRELAVCLRFCLVKREDRADHEVELRPDRMVWSRDGTMTCTWTSCRAGAHRVVVRRRGHDEPLHTVDVDVRSNAAKELRLPPMAVPALRVLHIHVPAAGAGYLWPAPVSEMVGTKRCESAVRDGDATWILASNAPTDLFVSVAGHRHVTLRGVDADMDVALAPGIPVVFECDLGERPPRERVTLTLVGDHEDEAVGATVRGGRAAVVAPAPGAYWLHAEGWPRASDFHCDPESVVVDDTGGTFRIVLRPEAR